LFGKETDLMFVNPELVFVWRRS